MLRAVDVAATPASAAQRGPAPVAVVIDVLRATSTIVTALQNGAAAVVPVREQEEAIAVMHRLGRERALLCGERDSRLIAGFDLDNSPASFAPGVVAGKTIILTTTNGTRALIEAANAKSIVYCGALLNRTAIATVLEASDADKALLVCAGDHGALSFEDFFCAGAIVAQLERAIKGLAISDSARAAAVVYGAYAKRVTTAIASGRHAKHLIGLGFADDVAACSRIDVSSCIPRYADGVINAV